jgi:DNA-directed RNA polymerase specialized sigma24 family protein
VVRHQTIDWLRARHGRERVPVAVQSLPPLERRIVELVFVKRHNHVEAYELVRAREGAALSFREYLVALRSVYQAVGAGYLRTAEAELAQSLLAGEPAVESEDEAARRGQLVQRVLAELPPGDRVLLQLYVMEGMAADAVARWIPMPRRPTTGRTGSWTCPAQAQKAPRARDR